MVGQLFGSESMPAPRHPVNGTSVITDKSRHEIRICPQNTPRGAEKKKEFLFPLLRHSACFAGKKSLLDG
jgi:hypothetical protein